MSVLGLAEARSVLLVILTLCLPPLYIVQSERLAEWRRETERGRECCKGRKMM